MSKTSRTDRRLAHAVALYATVLLIAPAAVAEPTPAERVAARTLFEDARAAMKSGDFKTACPKLEESQRLDPGVGTQFNLAACYEGEGRLASAWTTYLDAAEASKLAGQSDRTVAAKGRADALEPRLAHLRVTVTAGTDAPTLKLDGGAFPHALVGTAVPVDPGHHLLAADAPGKTHWEAHVDLREGATAELSVPALEAAPTPPPPVAVPLPTPPPAIVVPPGPPPAPPRVHDWHTPAAIAAGTGAVLAIGIGTVYGVTTINDWSNAKSGCPNNVCNSTAYPSWSSAHSAGDVSTVSFVVGGVLAAGGLTLWVTRPSTPVQVGMGTQGVAVAVRF